MKALAYVNDHRYYLCDGVVYSSGSMTTDVWKRFLCGFDRVTVFSSIQNATPEEVESFNAVSCGSVEFVDIGYVSGIGRFIGSMFSAPKTFRERLKDYDAVVVRIPGLISFSVARYCLKNKIPLGAEVVGCPFDAYWNYGRFEGKLIAPLMYLTMRSLVQRISHVVYVTKRFLQNRYPTYGKSIHASNVNILAVGEDVLANRIRRNMDRAQGGLLPIRIGLMGSVGVRYKGHAELLRALSLIKERLPPVSVEFVGPGDYGWVEDLAEELGLIQSIKIHGKLRSGKPVIDWLDTLDIYIHPSRQEGLPRSVIEAMSRGCPVLASSIAGTPELIDPVYLHKPGNFEQLSNQIIVLLEDRPRLNSMATKNFEDAKLYYADYLNGLRVGFWSDFSDSLNQ